MLYLRYTLWLKGCDEMELLAGITGFYAKKDGAPPQINEEAFIQFCTALMQQQGGEVKRFEKSQQAMNFYYAEVIWHNKRFYIVVNAHYPYLAFAEKIQYGEIIFMEAPFAMPAHTPYRVLSLAELTTPTVGAREWAPYEKLHRTEIAQISYWRPATIGEIVFNFWD